MSVYILQPKVPHPFSPLSPETARYKAVSTRRATSVSPLTLQWVLGILNLGSVVDLPRLQC